MQLSMRHILEIGFQAIVSVYLREYGIRKAARMLWRIECNAQITAHSAKLSPIRSPKKTKWENVPNRLSKITIPSNSPSEYCLAI